MCNPMALMAAAAVTSASGAASSASAQKSSLLYNAGVADNNAQIAEWQAQDAEYRGKMDEQASRMQTAAIKSTQKTAMAANGVDITQGSPTEVLTSTDYMGERDAMTIRDNALRAAWGYRTQGVNYQDSAQAQRAGASSISPTNAAIGSLIGSAGQVAGAWYGMSKSGVGTTGGAGPTVGGTGFKPLVADSNGWFNPAQLGK